MKPLTVPHIQRSGPGGDVQMRLGEDEVRLDERRRPDGPIERWYAAELFEREIELRAAREHIASLEAQLESTVLGYVEKLAVRATVSEGTDEPYPKSLRCRMFALKIAPIHSTRYVSLAIGMTRLDISSWAKEAAAQVTKLMQDELERQFRDALAPFVDENIAHAA